MRKLIKRIMYLAITCIVLVAVALIYVTNPVLGSVPSFLGELAVDSNQLRADVEAMAA